MQPAPKVVQAPDDATAFFSAVTSGEPPSTRGQYMRKLLRFFLVLLGSCVTFTAFAEKTAETVVGADRCSQVADPKWKKNEGEMFVWESACRGLEADLEDKFGGGTDPRDVENWPKQRTLTAKFLETILIQKKYRGELTRLGVRITGARFEERI